MTASIASRSASVSGTYGCCTTAVSPTDRLGGASVSVVKARPSRRTPSRTPCRMSSRVSGELPGPAACSRFHGLVLPGRGNEFVVIFGGKQLVDFGRVRQPELDEPPVAVRVAVHELRLLDDLVVR